jgi:hypothetical protein
MGLVSLRKGNSKDAEKFLLSAISFDPHNADYFGAVSLIKLNDSKWEDALTYANRGLQADPENLVCLNSRSTALLKLDRKEESYQTIKEALHNDPHNSYTHANLGWGLLERGDHKKALESFREALKLDPENHHAKAGLVEALKARYGFYRIFLRYAFWIQNLKPTYQWIFVLGIYFGVRWLNSASETNPTLAMYAKPVIYLYILFALSTWIIDPLSNLFLRLNVYGRYALSRDQVKASNFAGAGALITLLGIAGVIIYGTTFMGGFYQGVFMWGIGIMLLLGTMFNPTKPSKRRIAVILACGLVVIGLLSLVTTATGGNGRGLWVIFLYGAVAYQWILNALTIK